MAASKRQVGFQTQEQLTKRKNMQAQLEIYHNENYLMIFAEIQRLFGFLGQNVGYEFRSCLMAGDQNITMVMMNIEGFLDALDGFRVIGENKKLEQYLPPTNCGDLYEKWSEALKRVPPGDQERETAKELLGFLLEKLSQKEPLTKLPEHISEKILSTKQRDIYFQEINNKNGQQKMMMLVNATQQLADNLSAQVEKLAENPRNLKFSRRQKIDVHREDIPGYLFDDFGEAANQGPNDPLIEKKKNDKDENGYWNEVVKVLKTVFCIAAPFVLYIGIPKLIEIAEQLTA